MKVKIGNNIFDSEKEPIMLIFENDSEKNTVSNHLRDMQKTEGKRLYLQAPRGTSEEQMEEFMDMPISAIDHEKRENHIHKIARIETANILIEFISSLGREFFKHESTIAHFEFNANKIGDIVYIDQYSKKSIEMSKEIGKGKPYHFNNGGTLWALVQDFYLYIITGEDTDGEHGRGGLYCQHWGYKESDMELIREKAVQLGYLKN